MRTTRMEVARLAILPIVAAVAYSAISIYRHDHFGSNAFDLGVQDQTVWGYSQLQMIPNTVAMIRNLLGDHFHPILATIAPLYWIWNDARMLLIVQAALLALGGVPIFLWARERLGEWPAILLEAAYLLFWGVLSAVIYDFHHIAFAVPAISFALYGALTKRDRMMWVALTVGLLSRENVALTFAALGFYLLIVQRRWQMGALMIGLCSAWFVALIDFVIPAIAGGRYGHWSYEALGSGPGSALLHIVRHPISSFALLFDNGTKLKLWGGLLGSWLFLPLPSPIFLVAIPSILERLWSSEPTLWSASFHYSMVIAPILAFAAIDTLDRAGRMLRGGAGHRIRTFGPALVLAGGLVITFALVRPLDELGSYVSAARVADIQSCLRTIPAQASVSASNALLPHLSHRKEIYLLTVRTDADMIAIDVATYAGHFFPGEQDQIRRTISSALSAGYGIACSRGTTVVLQRDGGAGTLSPELAAFIAGGG